MNILIKHLKVTFLSSIVGFLSACDSDGPKADMILTNATIYTAEDTQPKAEAVAILEGKIIQVGTSSEIMKMAGDSTAVLDLAGKYVYPGFIEGHAHILGMGSNLLNVNLMGTKSYDEMIEKIKARADQTPKGTWITGRGWHQDKWDQQPESMFNGFPTHHRLSEAVPDHPVWMKHASGHAGIANAKAMEMAGINKNTNSPEGGEVFKDISGQPTGIFNETAQSLVSQQITKTSDEDRERMLQLAIDECLQNGITGFHQAGSRGKAINLFKSFAKSEKLKLRLYVMLTGKDITLLDEYFEKGPQIGLYDDHLWMRSVKLYADGALGSRGAWLLKEYSDAKGVHGHNVTPLDSISYVVDRAIQNGFQVCTHAIGDRANQEVLDIYDKAFNDNPEISKDHRFRIEHAQHMHPDDIPRFAELGVIPAMQAIHMSSDRPWAIDRLGKTRIENGAYMWSELIDNGSKIVNGTDAPVEPVNPFASFYASVSRKTLAGYPDEGFEPSQKMTRDEALKSYTLWPAYGAFMDDQVGSIKEGKYGDFTILDRDIMTIDEEEILDTKVHMTIIGGEILYNSL